MPDHDQPDDHEAPDEAVKPERPSYDPFPLWEIAVAVGVVVLVVAVLIFLLFQRTSGPGEVIHDFYTDAASGDCDAAYQLMTPQLQARVPSDQLCELLTDAGLTPDFEVERLVLTGDPGSSALVEVSGGASQGPADGRTVWTFELVDSDWLVDGACFTTDPGLQPLVEASAGQEACALDPTLVISPSPSPL